MREYAARSRVAGFCVVGVSGAFGVEIAAYRVGAQDLFKMQRRDGVDEFGTLLREVRGGRKEGFVVQDMQGDLDGGGADFDNPQAEVRFLSVGESCRAAVARNEFGHAVFRPGQSFENLRLRPDPVGKAGQQAGAGLCRGASSPRAAEAEEAESSSVNSVFLQK